MIIDFHNHIGPSRDGGYGTLEELLTIMDSNNIIKAVLFATDEEGFEPTFQKENNRILNAQAKYPDRIIAFARIIPSAGKIAMDEFERCLSEGIKGLKLKASDGFQPEEAIPLFDKVATRKNFPILMHTDHSRIENQPSTWEACIKRYPKLNFIMAHGGKAHYQKCAEIAKANANAYIDTSTLSLHRTQMIYEIAGAKNIIFASDYPYSHPHLELEKFRLFVQDENDLNLIFYKNAQNLLGL